VYRIGDYKLIAGYPGHDSGWYPPEQVYTNVTDSREWVRYIEQEAILYEERLAAGNESYYKLFNLRGMSMPSLWNKTFEKWIINFNHYLYYYIFKTVRAKLHMLVHQH